MKIVVPVGEISQLVIDLPGIWEIQNRGKNYTTYNFTSPIEPSVGSYVDLKSDGPEGLAGIISYGRGPHWNWAAAARAKTSLPAMPYQTLSGRSSNLNKTQWLKKLRANTAHTDVLYIDQNLSPKPHLICKSIL